MWPFSKRAKGSPLPQHVLNWPDTLPEEPLDADDRDLIRDRWTRALHRGFTCEPDMRAAFSPPGPLEWPIYPPPGYRDMTDRQREFADMLANVPLDTTDSPARLRACVAVLASLDLPDQAAKLGEYIAWARDTGGQWGWKKPTL